jgi:hypothetical protein
MLTAALEKTDEENCIAGKIILAIFPLEAPKEGAGLSGGRRMNREKTGGEGPSGAVFGWSWNSF